MSGIDEVLERLVTDRQFREQLRHHPATALSGYVLYDEDLELLVATLDEGQGNDHGVEQRTSKSAFLAALTGLVGGTGAPSAGGGDDAAGVSNATRFDAPTDLRDLPDPEDEVYVGAGKVGSADMRDLPDPDDEIYDTAGDDGVDLGREFAVPDPGGGEDAEGPAGLRSDGELVQASDARDMAETEGFADGDEEDPETALPRSGRSPRNMAPGIEGSGASTDR